MLVMPEQPDLLLWTRDLTAGWAKDFSRAFHTVSHGILPEKLATHGLAPFSGLKTGPRQSYRLVQSVWKAVQQKTMYGCWTTRAEHEPVVFLGSQEGRWHAGLHQHQCGHQDEDSNCPSIFSIGEVISHVLCPVLSPSLHWGAEACPEKDKGAGEGSEAHVLWKAAQLRLFSLGKRGLRDKLITLYSYLKRVCSHVGVHCQFMSSLWSTSIPKSFPPCCSQSVHTQPASVPEAAPPRMWHLALGLVKPHIFLWTYSFYLSRPLDGI